MRSRSMRSSGSRFDAVALVKPYNGDFGNPRKTRQCAAEGGIFLGEGLIMDVGTRKKVFWGGCTVVIIFFCFQQ